MKKANKSDASSLRQRAEELLRKKIIVPASNPPESELLKLIHEMEVHQIELVLQNEELIRAKTATDATIETYEEMYDIAPSGYFTLSRDGKIIHLNHSGAQILGKESSNLIGSSFGFFISVETKPIFTTFLEKIFKTGIKESCEITIFRDKDLPQHFFFTGSISENTEECLLIATDITLRKSLEDKLYKNAEEEINAILRTTIDGYYLVDIEGRILDTNDSYCMMIGYSREELKGMRVKDIEAADTEEVIKKRIQQILETGYTRFETRHRRKDGKVIDIEASVNYLIDKKPKLFCFMRDISDRKEAEEKLLVKESDLNHAQKIANIGSWKFDNITQIPVWSENMYHIFGLNPENGPLDYQGHKRVICPDDWEEFDNAVQLASRTGTGYKLNIRIRRPNGEVRWIMTESETKKDSEGNVVELFGVCHDITERKKVEEALEQSHSILFKLSEQVPGVIYQYRLYPDGRSCFPYSSSGMYKIYEYYSDDVREDATLAFGRLHPEDLQRVSDLIFESARNLTHFHCEFRVILPEQGLRWRYSDAMPERMPDDSTLWHGIIFDITDRKLAEYSLVIEKDNFRHSLDDSPLGIRIVSKQGKTIYVNQTLLDIYGFDSLEEMQKVPLENRYTQESFAEAQKRKTARVKGNLTATNYDVSIIKKNGEIHHLKGYSKKVLWDGIWQFQIIYEDITEIKTREIELENSREQLKQLNLYLQRVREEERKLISRELHDELGQSLTAIKIDLGIIKNNLSDQNELSQKLEKISSLLNDSIISVQRLTSELRPHILDDLGLVAAIDWYIGEYIKRTGLVINLNIDKSISLPNEVELVIFRILQESLTNIARHSKAGNAEIIFYRQKSDVILEIKDDGIGISSVDRKSPKSLGLLNMSERAREIGGKFIIESRKKQGTRICLTVPDILFEE